MKKVICAVLALVCLLACMTAVAEESSSLALIDDGDGTAVVTISDGTEPQQEATPATDITDETVATDVADGEDAAPQQEAQEAQVALSDSTTSNGAPAVRWTFGVSLNALQGKYLVLANADNLLDSDFEPEPLIRVRDVKRSTSADVYLEETAAKALKEMFDAAALVTEYTYMSQNSKGEQKQATAKYDEDTGMRLFLESGYRSYGTQQTMYTNRLARNNNVDDGWVAKPGASDHQTGLAADIVNADVARTGASLNDSFQWTPEAQWMKEHCAEFGFILRFPNDKQDVTGINPESWHFRYVGKEVAGYIMSQGITLEEFVDEADLARAEFVGRGGNEEEQMAYELSRLNAPPESYVLDEFGEDGDAEVSLVF